MDERATGATRGARRTKGGDRRGRGRGLLRVRSRRNPAGRDPEGPPQEQAHTLRGPDPARRRPRDLASWTARVRWRAHGPPPGPLASEGTLMTSDFTDRFDLASMRLGGAVIAANDDYFAEKENLLRPGAA